jgi:hypothetical protein
MSRPFQLYCARCGAADQAMPGQDRICVGCGSTHFLDDNRSGVDVGRPIRERWATRGTRRRRWVAAVTAAVVAIAVVVVLLVLRHR